MNLSHFKRIKQHRFPGSVPKSEVEEMRERRGRFAEEGEGERGRARNYIRTQLKTRERAVLKERARKEIEDEVLSHL